MGGGSEVLLSQCHPICLKVNGLELFFVMFVTVHLV